MSSVERIRTRETSRPHTKAFSRITLSYVSISDLRPSNRRLRKHSEEQYERLTAGLRKFGCVVPVLTDEDNTLIDGEAVVEAARRNGMAEVPAVKVTHLSKPEERALRLALNKLPTLSKWNEVVLKAELEYLSSVEFELPTFTAFGSAEIDALTRRPSEISEEPEQLVLPASDEIVSRAGDIWECSGGHKLGCLDSLNEASYPAIMAGEQAGLIFCDAPYNVPIRGHVTGRASAREFAMASGEMSSEQFTAFLETTFRHCNGHAREGCLSLQFMDWRHTPEMLAAGYAVYTKLLNIVVWVKTNPGMGSPWRSGHELCFVWKQGTAPHIDNVRLGRHGRNRSNVWTYPGANQHRDRDSKGHVTPKNLYMIQDAILDVSDPGDIVLDAFAGSATTLVAAHLSGRRGYGLEIDPAYVDLGVRRMEARTGAPARHIGSGRTFAETSAERRARPVSPARGR